MKQPVWGGVVAKLGGFKIAGRLDKCEPWNERTNAPDACLALEELIKGYVQQVQTQAAMARLNRKGELECVLRHAEPAYIALVGACMSEDVNGHSQYVQQVQTQTAMTGHSQYRIVPGQVEELERPQFDPVLLRVAYPLTIGCFEDICVDALAILESVVALEAAALLQQASAMPYIVRGSLATESNLAATHFGIFASHSHSFWLSPACSTRTPWQASGAGAIILKVTVKYAIAARKLSQNL